MLLACTLVACTRYNDEDVSLARSVLARAFSNYSPSVSRCISVQAKSIARIHSLHGTAPNRRMYRA